MTRHPNGAVGSGLVLVAAMAAACGGQIGGRVANDPEGRRLELMARAWQPVTTRQLEEFLVVRRALKPTFDRYRDGIMQGALREASTRPLLTAMLMGNIQLSRDLDQALKKQQLLTSDDYDRLTLLVYGHWLRAVRSEPPPERYVLRVLQELEIGVSRRLAIDTGLSNRDREQQGERLKSIRQQLRFTAPWALADKAQTLARIDPQTRAWLDAHRAEVEALDFELFDTEAPSRNDKPGGPRPGPAPTQPPPGGPSGNS